MNGLEIALIILVSIWSLIFVAIGIAMLIVFLMVRRAVKKVNKILDKSEQVANEVDLPNKIVMAIVAGFTARNAYKKMKNAFSDIFSKKKSK